MDGMGYEPSPAACSLPAVVQVLPSVRSGTLPRDLHWFVDEAPYFFMFSGLIFIKASLFKFIISTSFSVIDFQAVFSGCRKKGLAFMKAFQNLPQGLFLVVLCQLPEGTDHDQPHVIHGVWPRLDRWI